VCGACLRAVCSGFCSLRPWSGLWFVVFRPVKQHARSMEEAVQREKGKSHVLWQNGSSGSESRNGKSRAFWSHLFLFSSTSSGVAWAFSGRNNKLVPFLSVGYPESITLSFLSVRLVGSSSFSPSPPFMNIEPSRAHSRSVEVFALHQEQAVHQVAVLPRCARCEDQDLRRRQKEDPLRRLPRVRFLTLSLNLSSSLLSFPC
jgi:hypothetical protein